MWFRNHKIVSVNSVIKESLSGPIIRMFVNHVCVHAHHEIRMHYDDDRWHGVHASLVQCSK